jgi:electron transport complex protein RnfE
MADASYRDLSLNGLWKNNPAMVQLLGLCPLLAVSSCVVNALGLGIATTLVLILSNTVVSMLRNQVPDSVRLPAFVMIIASAVTCIELLVQAFAYELFLILGLFLPLITTNCVVLGRAETFASKNPLLPSVYDGFMMGAGFACVLVVLGGLRELSGTGALFAHMDLLFGPGAADWQIVLFPDYQPFLLAILPPGAFIFAGLMIAAKNLIDAQVGKRQAASQPPPVPGAKRVRVTGHIS